MAFIEESDYTRKIKDEHLLDILDGEVDAKTDAEATAIAVVEGHLFEKYDTEAIFAAEDDARSKLVLMWVTNLVIYYLYERIDDNLFPEMVKDNYTETMETLKSIQKGEISFKLPLLLIDEDGDGELDDPITIRRAGSTPQRDFSIY